MVDAPDLKSGTYGVMVQVLLWVLNKIYIIILVSLMVEQLPSKQKVIGSSPIPGKGTWQSGYCGGL